MAAAATAAVVFCCSCSLCCQTNRHVSIAMQLLARLVCLLFGLCINMLCSTERKTNRIGMEVQSETTKANGRFQRMKCIFLLYDVQVARQSEQNVSIYRV